MTVENDSKLSVKSGLPPGSLVHIGTRKEELTKISAISYSEDDTQEEIFNQVEDCFPLKNDSKNTSWININGLHNTEVIAKIGKHFGLHLLSIEDILNTAHRPRTEVFDSHIMVSLKILGIGKNGHSIVSEQISLVLGDGWLLSFQEQEGDIFNPLRERLREGKGLFKSKKADYLLYRIIDTIVDNYFFVIEHISESLETLEGKVLENSNKEQLLEIQKMKRQLRALRKSVSPLREAVSMIHKETTNLVLPENQIYLRDIYEHIIQIIETIETQRDLATGVMDLYLTGVSNTMNQTMQVLTIIATIFIPLTFITGVYGMNFDNMPELYWKYGYLGVWSIMILVIVFMVAYFKRKDWL